MCTQQNFWGREGFIQEQVWRSNAKKRVNLATTLVAWARRVTAMSSCTLSSWAPGKPITSKAHDDERSQVRGEAAAAQQQSHGDSLSTLSTLACNSEEKSRVASNLLRKSSGGDGQVTLELNFNLDTLGRGVGQYHFWLLIKLLAVEDLLSSWKLTAIALQITIKEKSYLETDDSKALILG